MGKRTETIEIVGKDKASSVLRTIGSSVKDLNRAARESGIAGKNSIFGLIAGGGAAAGISLVASGLKSWAAEARRMTNEFREGKASVGDIADSAAASVPIFGQVWQAGQGIRATIKDSVAAWLEMQGASDAVVRSWESGETSLKRQTEEADKLLILQAKYRAELGPTSDKRLIGKKGADLEIQEAKLAGLRKDQEIVADRMALKKDVREGKIGKSYETAELKAIYDREGANIENTKRKVGEIEMKWNVRRQNQAAASVRRIADINAEGAEAELKAAGKKYDAEASAIRRGAESQEEAIKSAYRTQKLNMSPSDAKTLLEQSRSEIGAIRIKMAADLNALNTETARKNFEDRQKMQEEAERQAERDFEKQKKLAEEIRGHPTGGVAAIHGRFISGAGLAGNEREVGSKLPEDKNARDTAKNTAISAKADAESAAALKDIAGAVRNSPTIIIGIGIR